MSTDVLSDLLARLSLNTEATTFVESGGLSVLSAPLGDPGETRDMLISVRPTTDEGWDLVTSRSLQVVSEQGKLVCQGRLSENGRLILRGLPSGSYRLREVAGSERSTASQFVMDRPRVDRKALLLDLLRGGQEAQRLPKGFLLEVLRRMVGEMRRAKEDASGRLQGVVDGLRSAGYWGDFGLAYPAATHAGADDTGTPERALPDGVYWDWPEHVRITVHEGTSADTVSVRITTDLPGLLVERHQGRRSVRRLDRPFDLQLKDLDGPPNEAWSVELEPEEETDD